MEGGWVSDGIGLSQRRALIHMSDGGETSMRSKRNPIPRAFWVLTLGVGSLSGCSPKPPSHTVDDVSTSGEHFTVEAKSLDDFRPVSGEYATRDQADARARIAGTLIDLKVKEGERVKRGQVIALIRDDRIGLQTRAFDAQTSAAAAEAARAEADLARTQDLYEHGVYAKARLEQVEAVAKATRAQLAAARAQSAASSNLAHQGEVLAPASGIVLHAQTPAGSVVMPGQAIATITAGPPIIRLQVPEAQARSLQAGQSMTVTGDGGDASVATSVLQIYPSVTSGEATIDLAAPKAAAGLIGSRVDVVVPVGHRLAIAVPSRFLSHRYGVDYVRVLKKDGTASEIVVQTGTQVGSATEVLSGLAPGDVILGPGADR